jgi:hypothetical protein
MSSDRATGASAWHSANVTSAGDLAGISCGSSLLCVASDPGGNVVASADPSGAAGAWTVQDVAPGSAVTGGACHPRRYSKQGKSERCQSARSPSASQQVPNLCASRRSEARWSGDASARTRWAGRTASDESFLGQGPVRYDSVGSKTGVTLFGVVLREGPADRPDRPSVPREAVSCAMRVIRAPRATPDQERALRATRTRDRHDEHSERHRCDDKAGCAEICVMLGAVPGNVRRINARAIPSSREQ